MVALMSSQLLQVLGTFGGLGAAGLSASLLTSVLPTTLEDLLALAFCSAGGYEVQFFARSFFSLYSIWPLCSFFVNFSEHIMNWLQYSNN